MTGVMTGPIMTVLMVMFSLSLSSGALTRTHWMTPASAAPYSGKVGQGWRPSMLLVAMILPPGEGLLCRIKCVASRVPYMTPLRCVSVQLLSGSGGRSSTSAPRPPKLYHDPLSTLPALAISRSSRPHLAHTDLNMAAWDEYEDTSHCSNTAVSPEGSRSAAFGAPTSARRPTRATRQPFACRCRERRSPMPLFERFYRRLCQLWWSLGECPSKQAWWERGRDGGKEGESKGSTNRPTGDNGDSCRVRLNRPHFWSDYLACSGF
ncbi:hypothetical protein VTG60DRAFT_2743 [Thermothelomyces hinnuleus]